MSVSCRSNDSDSSCYPSQSSPSHRNDTDESSKTSELRDVQEVVTNSMIIAFLQVISTLRYNEFNPVKPRPVFSMLPDHIKFVLMGASLTSENDGSGWKTRWSRSGRQYVNSGGAPLLTVKVRSRFLSSPNKRPRDARNCILMRFWLRKLENYWLFSTSNTLIMALLMNSIDK